MSPIPSLPDVLSADNFGGLKEDYSPIEDPATDRSADEVNPLIVAASEMTATAIRAFVVFTGAATDPAVTNGNHRAVWGSSDAVLPTVDRFSTGVYDITWPASITSDFGDSIAVNLVTGFANIAGSTLGNATLTITAPNVARLRTFNTSNSANDLVGSVLSVFVL